MSRRRGFADVDVELRLEKAEVAQFLRHGLRELRGGSAAAARNFGALSPDSLLGFREAGFQFAKPFVAVLERIELRALLRERRRGIAVLAAHAVHDGEPAV